MTSSSSLSQKALSGTFYYSAIRWIDRIASILSAVVLARLLEPGDFGLVALAMTAIALFGTLTDTGLGAGLIQRSDYDRHYYDVVWTYGRFFRGILLFTIMLFLAPWVAIFYHEPQLTIVLQILVINELFTGLTNIGVIDFEKKLDFKKDFYLNLSGRITRLIVVITLAFLWRNVWALVAGTLANGGVRLIMSYILHPFRPKFNFDLKRARDLFTFGGWLMGVQIVNMVRGIMDRAILGRLMGAIELGYYQIGVRFGQETPTEVKTIVSKVMFPVYSLMQNDNNRMANSFRQVFSLVLFLSLPICVGLSLTAEYFVFLVLGPKWEPAIPIIRILAIAGCLQIVVGIGTPLFKGAGYPKYELIITLFLTLVTLGIIVPLTVRFGFIGTSFGMLCGLVITLPLWWIFIHRITNISFKETFLVVLPPLSSTILMVGGIFLIRFITKNDISWLSFLSILFVAFIIFISCTFFCLRVVKLPSLEKLFVQFKPYVSRLAVFLSK